MSSEIQFHAKTLDDQLIQMTQEVDRELNLSVVRDVVLPKHMLSASEAESKHDKFGLVLLDDGSAGFFYRLLEVDMKNLQRYRELAAASCGQSLSELVQNLKSDDLFERAISLGAANAATTSLFRAAGFTTPAKPSSTKPDARTNGQKRLQKIGMVGYFKQQVATLLEAGHEVVVLELNDAFHTEQEGLQISNSIETLADCNLVYCTASTLINNTVEGLLGYFTSLPILPHIEVIGPSAGCFPDVLFTRGVAVVGGSTILDVQLAVERVGEGMPWADAVTKFALPEDDYPGFDNLLARAKENLNRLSSR